MISWGDPVLPNAPKFDVANQSGAAQRGQFGFNNDFAGLLPVPGQQNRFLLVTNFEYVDPTVHVPRLRRRQAPTREQFDIEIAAIGMGVVEVERTPEGLKPVMGRYNRRITADTPMTLTGPAAGTDFVKTAADPTGRTIAGTFANCAGGVTPWGTVLSGEENFQEYFGAARDAPRAAPVDADRQDRYGIALEPSSTAMGDLRSPLRPRQDRQRAEPVRLRRRAQPVGSELDADQALRTRADQARGRQRLHHRRRHRRGVHRRRRTLRLHVQVHLEQEDAAWPRIRRPSRTT